MTEGQAESRDTWGLLDKVVGSEKGKRRRDFALPVKILPWIQKVVSECSCLSQAPGTFQGETPKVLQRFSKECAMHKLKIHSKDTQVLFSFISVFILFAKKKCKTEKKRLLL